MTLRLKTNALLAAAFAFGTAFSAAAQTVGIGSNPQGSAAYATAAAIAKVVSENSDMRMRVIPQGGPVVTIPLVNTGEMEFSVSNSMPLFFAQKGGAMFKDNPQPAVKMVAALYNLNVGFFVKAGSDIRTLEDLKGKRVSSEFTKQRVLHTMQQAILATAGMTMDDVEGVPVPSGGRGVEDFSAGNVDAGLFSAGSGAVLQADAAVGGIRFIPIPTDDAAQAALVAKAPGSYIETLAPAEGLAGIAEPTGFFAGPFLILAGDNTSEDMVYEVTKLIYANAESLWGAAPQFAKFDPANMAPDLKIEMHPGAIRFYQEVGLLP
jgi:hypothetical protein